MVGGNDRGAYVFIVLTVAIGVVMGLLIPLPIRWPFL